MKRLRAWWCKRYGHRWIIAKVDIGQIKRLGLPYCTIKQVCTRCGKVREWGLREVL